MKKYHIILIALALCLSPLAHAAIAFDSASSTSNITGNATSISWNHVVGAGSNEILLIAVNAGGTTSEPINTVTYGGDALTKIASSEVHTTQTGWTMFWYLLAPPTGANTATVNLVAGTKLNIAGISASYTGVAQSGIPDANSTGTATTGATFTSTVTTVSNNDWAIALAVNNQAATVTAGTGSHSRIEATNFPGGGGMLADSNSAITPAGVYKMNFGSTSGFWQASEVALAPFVAASTPYQYYSQPIIVD